MPPISATVYFANGATTPSVSPDPINVPSGNGATVIQWGLGTDVTNFTITGLNSSEFNPSASQSNVTSFSTTDSNNNSSTYNYNVTATHTDGYQASHDPTIKNGT